MRWLLWLLLMGPQNSVWSLDAVGQMRFLYQHMRTEFAGCLYGQVVDDTIRVAFFISSTTDPRQASDSEVMQGGCPGITTTTGNHFIGLAHSHIRNGSICYPSGKDQRALDAWKPHGALFGAIMCAHGDSIAMFSDSAFGVFPVPSLDSLYQRVR